MATYAQVKIGDNPTVISPSAVLETESTSKGFLKPRLTTAQRTAIAAPATGLEVYDTDTQSNWYYNGTVWVNGASTNIYNADGTLTGNRTVTQGANTLSFTGSAVNAFSVDGTTFSVDAANNAIGLGTAAPNTNAVIDATAVNKGILFPRVALTATNLPAPLSAFVAGMTVYNTATASSGATAVTPGLYYTDGTKWVQTGDDYAADPTVGSISAFPFSAIPTGYLECNGAAVSRTTYADLFAKIGTSYGAGDGSTTFNVPDLRGEFIRGFDNGRGVDAGRALGSTQVDATSLPNTAFSTNTVADHTHSVDPPSTTTSTNGSHSHTTGGAVANGNTNGTTGSVTGSNFGLIQRSDGSVSNTTDGIMDFTAGEPSLNSSVQNHFHTTDAQGTHAHTVDILPVSSSASGAHNHSISGGDAETRPRNVAMVYAIKAVDNVIVPTYATTAITAAAAANEPWFKVGTATGASSNTDDVYINGNVGIRTSTPVVSLDARGSIHFDDATTTATANQQGGYLTWNRTNLGGTGQGYYGFLNHQGIGNGGFVFTTTNDNTTFNERMRITGTGNVGIGTTAPTAALQVVNNATGDDNKDDVIIRSFGAVNSSGFSVQKSFGTETAPSDISNGTYLGIYAFGGRWNSAYNFGASSISSRYRGNGTTTLTDMEFVTSNATRMYINENGNVGIGTSSPSGRLHVAQPGNGVPGLTGSTNYSIFESTSNSSSTGLQFKALNSAGVAKIVNMGINPNFDANNGLFAIIDDPGNTILGVNLNSRNVGIGNNSPSERLDVSGNLKFSGALMPNNNAGTSGQILESRGAGTAPVFVNKGFGESETFSVTLASGATSTVTLSILAASPFGASYKLYVSGVDGCGFSFFDEYMVAGSDANSAWRILPVMGVNSASPVATSFSTSGNTIAATRAKFACGDGGTGASLDYTIVKATNTKNFTITNNGNVTRTYRIRVVSY